MKRINIYLIITAVLLIALGVVCIFNPGESFASATWLLGVIILVSGLSSLIFGLRAQAFLPNAGSTTLLAMFQIIVGLMLAIVIFATGRWPEKIRMGKMRWPMIFYLSSIFMHGITGLALMIKMPGTSYAMLGLGSFLFMVSDIDLNVYRFILNNNKWLIRFNSLTYFGGLLLIVLSTVYA